MIANYMCAQGSRSCVLTLCHVYSVSPSLAYCRFSGLTAEDFVGISTSLQDVQRQLQSIVYEDSILVGHSLESDLRALKVAKTTGVTNTRTAICAKYKGTLTRTLCGIV